MLRPVAMVLALLAGAKIWTQEQLYRRATEEALVSAYQARAIATCRAVQPSGNAGTLNAAAQRNLSDAFAKPASIHLVIGNPDVPVQIWDVDHAAWAMRYTYPYIVLETGSPGQAARCSYDVKLNRAQISLL